VNVNKDIGIIMVIASHVITLARNVITMAMITVNHAKKIGFWMEISVFVYLS
jgi:hypothetical protein